MEGEAFCFAIQNLSHFIILLLSIYQLRTTVLECLENNENLFLVRNTYSVEEREALALV